jgi:hypothetical protein
MGEDENLHLAWVGLCRFSPKTNEE